MASKLATAKAALRGHENCAPDCGGRLGLLELERHERIEQAATALVERWDDGDFRVGPVCNALLTALATAVRTETP